MANTPNENLMSELASQMISQIGSFFERINASPSRPIGNFSGETAQNYLYVLYSANGLPLFAGVVTTSGGRRGEARAQKGAQALAAGGYVASYRTVEFGSENMAVQIERLVSDLFGAALPLSAGSNREGAEVATTRRRGRPGRKAASADGAAAAPRRRGRPGRKAAIADGAVTESPRRRGRPRKVEAEAAAPARRPGRPRKVVEAGAEGPKRRPGRPRKNTTEAAAPARRPGRPRKIAAEEGSAAPRRPGRPRKEGSTRASRAGGGTKRAGRPRGARKGEETGTTE